MPLKKRKGHELPTVEVSVVPLMDVLTTLLFFLLVMGSSVKFFVVPAASQPPGQASTENKPSFSLQVILKDPTTAYVYLGPLRGLKVSAEEELRTYLQKNFKGDEASGFYRKIETKVGQDIRVPIQESLSVIKTSFPSETRAVAAFSDKVPYQSMVDIVTSVRELPSEKARNVKKAPWEKKSISTVLFPSVVVSEWNEGAGS